MREEIKWEILFEDNSMNIVAKIENQTFIPSVGDKININDDYYVITARMISYDNHYVRIELF